MTEKPTYYDKRAEFWKRRFDMAKPYDEFIAESDQEKAARWRETAERLPELTPEQAERLRGWARELNVLMYGGIWCHDCARQGPMLRKIADAAGPQVRLRVIDREASEELQDELRILGALRVPMVVFLTEDFWEVGRFGDRMLTVYRAKAAREIGRGPPAGVLSPRALEAEMAEWVDILERMLTMVRLSPPLRKRHGD
ncbi:MAG TPA: thioredoxin family protein [Candidatus Bathyarchaeia archaeon]